MSAPLPWLFGIAGGLGLLSLAVPHDASTNEVGVLLTAAFSLALAAFLAIRRPALGVVATSWVVAAAIVMASSAVVVTGGIPNASTALYLWIALYAFYALPRNVALGHAALIAVVYAGIIVADPPEDPAWAHWTTSVGTLFGAGLLVHALKSRLDAAVDHFAHAALTDALTGLANRRAFHAALERELGRARREGQPTGLVLLDLDRFKELNDRLGHGEGDRVLREVGLILRREGRLGDLVARVGGEELAVLLPGATTEQAARVAERLRRAVHDHVAVPAGHVTASFGVAATPEDAEDPDGLVLAADRALYAAKGQGRDRVARPEPAFA